MRQQGERKLSVYSAKQHRQMPCGHIWENATGSEIHSKALVIPALWRQKQETVHSRLVWVTQEGLTSKTVYSDASPNEPSY